MERILFRVHFKYSLYFLLFGSLFFWVIEFFERLNDRDRPLLAAIALELHIINFSILWLFGYLPQQHFELLEIVIFQVIIGVVVQDKENERMVLNWLELTLIVCYFNEWCCLWLLLLKIRHQGCQVYLVPVCIAVFIDLSFRVAGVIQLLDLRYLRKRRWNWPVMAA